MLRQLAVSLVSLALAACANAASHRPGDDAGRDAAAADAAGTDGGGDAGACTAPCADGVDCTVDTCDPGVGCVFTPDDGRCDPGQICDRFGGCLTLVECGEAADCAPYEDGNACNGTLHCPDGTCAVDPATVVACDPAGYPPCQAPTCQPATGECLPADRPDTTPCDDADPCTRDTACVDGACVGSESCCGNGADDDGDGATDCDDPDCTWDAACTECPTVPAPEHPSLSPLAGESPAGVTETVAEGGFTDDFLYNQAGELKVGTRREWGGSLIFYGMTDGSPGVNDTNAIDANDTGREVQVAFYDPDRIMQNCAWNASCQTTPTTCPGSIIYLGWDPVQGGNRCNHGSGVDAVDLSGGSLTVVTTPLFWNPNWDRQDCSSDACADPVLSWRRGDVQVTQRLRFVRYHVVELDYTVSNLAALDHAPTAQEMPTLYAANGNHGPDLWRLFDSTGTEVPIDTPAGGDGFYYENFTSPGGWATLQDDGADYGVGLYYENRTPSFQGWQLRSLPFNNFRAIFTFGIPASASVRARAYLMLGALGTQQGEAAWLDQNLAPFGVLDAPAEDATISGAVPVWGWALDNLGVTSVVLRVDGTTDVPLTYGGARPDVCLVWPGYAGCPAVGYSGTLDTSTLTPCQHLLEVVATDTSGNVRVIARRRVAVTW